MTTSGASRAWPIGLALSLAAGLAVSLAFAWIAAEQPRDQLAGDPWAAGDEYNADVRAQDDASARGWDVVLHAVRSAGGVQVELVPTSAREPLPAGLEVSLRRERPGRADLDAELPLEPRGSAWVAEVPLPLAGHWLLVARAGDSRAWVERRFALEVAP